MYTSTDIFLAFKLHKYTNGATSKKMEKLQLVKAAVLLLRSCSQNKNIIGGLLRFHYQFIFFWVQSKVLIFNCTLRNCILYLVS